MAENNGLQFNPWNGLNGFNTDKKQSVPTVATDYMMPQANPLDIKWNPKQLQKAKDLVNWVVNTPEEEKERVYNPLYDVDQWNGGYMRLPENEKTQWEKENSRKLFGKTDLEKDRIWKNQQFIKNIGMDAFQALKGQKEKRDEIYMDYLTQNAIQKKYGNNDNLGALMSLTPEGRIELLKSDYKSDWEMDKEKEQDDEKGWLDFSLGERWNAISNNAIEKGKEGMYIGGVAGGTVAGGAGTIVGMGVDGLVGLGYGAIRGLVMPETAKDYNFHKKAADNDEILNKISIADNDRKKASVQPEINDLYSSYLQAFEDGQISSAQVDEMFNQIALNGKRTVQDELGNTNEVDYQGSNYYSAFKDSDEFEHFGTRDKLKYIAQTETLAKKYGQGAAAQILDQDMQNYISDNQSGWTWAGNSLKNVWVGGVANLANNAVALGSLAAYHYGGIKGLTEGRDYTDAAGEALSNYLQGKDASGDDTENWLNPTYWNKVDQYNTFDKDAIAQADANGGVSVYNNVYTPGSENDFWSWSTLNEAVKMNKFAWSDLLKNLTLAKLVRGATRLTGGTEIAPGVLSTESTALSQFVNKAGAMGVMNASSLGIDAAYGMQTYEEVLRENNEKLDKIIDKDTEAEVQRRLQTPEALKDFRRFVDAENERRKKQAGENGTSFAVDEDKAFLDYTEYIRKQVRQEQEALHQEDRQKAQTDAANAYAIDASIEHLRMATTNGVFKSYLFDKGTLNALRGNNPYVNTTTKNGLYALGKNATKKSALQTLGMNVWGGFQSNYFDDITVGFAKAFGIQDYNNYLLQKYNPAAYGSVMDDYVNPFVAGMVGVSDAADEKRSFLDGAVGALGTVFTASPNVQGMLNHRQRMKEAAETAKKQGNENNTLSKAEWLSDFINNPVLQAYADAKAATRATEAEIKRRNDTLKDNAYAFDKIVETTTALNQKAIAREGTSIMEAEDAKDKEAFTLASSLLAMKNSAVVQNAQAEPNKANWSWKKKVANSIGQALNAMMGYPIFTQAESPYTRAMQTLQDASTIGETNDAETLARQQELVQTFLGLDANKNALEGKSEEEKVAFAEERLKKNATSMLDMMDKTEKLQQKFENSLQARMHPDIQQQLMYQYILRDRWKDRADGLEEQITGEKERESDPLADEHRVVAQYGSMKGYERVKKSQEKKLETAKKNYENAKEEAKKGNNPNLSIVENARLKAFRKFNEKTAKQNLEKEEAAYKKIAADESTLKGILESKTSGIPAEAILRLSPDERLRMLDDFYREDYSPAQQEQIDRAKNLLMRDGSTINEAMERVRDAAILNHRIEDNMEVAKRIMQNPVEASLMQEALVNNRRKAVIDYFNDKIVAEAFNDFAKDPEATLSQEKAAEKAKGYSTAVLNGMLRNIEKETNRVRKDDELSDKTLSILEDGIKTVLTERDDRLKNTVDLDSYIKKTKKVNHTETVRTPVLTVGQDNLNVVEKQVTTERELSQNDKRLLDNVLDYAAERGISVDELSDAVMTEDFNNYVQEKNHAYDLAVNPMSGRTVETNVGIPENRANLVSPEYISSLVKDVVNAYTENKNKVKDAKTDKVTADKPQSVATKPVETKGDVKTRNEGDPRPDEVDSNDIFGTKKKQEQAAEVKPSNQRNADILDSASTLNSKILADVNTLLDEVDKMQMDEKTRNKLKDIIEANLNSKTFGSVKELQNAIVGEAIITSEAEAPQINAKANAIVDLDISNIRNKKTDNQNTEQKEEKADEDNSMSQPLPPQPLVLETRDLDLLIDQPIWKDFIKSHNIVGFLQKLADVWNQEVEAYLKNRKQGLLHQSQVVFLYDPALAEQIKTNMGNQGIPYNPEISAPILMALEISDKNKKLVDDEAQLVSIKDKVDGKTKQYQVIGIMPASQARDKDSDFMKGVASRMADIRKRINYNDPDTHALRYVPNNDTGKYNAGIIKTGLADVISHTEEDRIPHATKETPKKNVQQLMDENLNSATESFVNATEEEKQAYEEAKSKGLAAARSTPLYKKLRRAFIDRLLKRERPGKTADDKDNKEIDFRVQKGTSDTYPRIVLTKAIGETVNKNTGRPIVDLLKEVDDEGNNAKEVIASNSRFGRLFKALSKLKLGAGLFNQNGNIINQATYKSTISDFENSISKAISNELNVDDLHVRVETSDGVPTEKTVNVQIYSGDINNSSNLLTTLTTKYNGQLSEAEYASFLKNLILDKEGNVRRGLNDSSYERVKWQVNYEDVTTANNKELSKDVRDAARANLEQLYDDGIFEMQVTKLAYPSRSVRVEINPLMKSRLYPERRNEPETPAPQPTETKAAFEAEGPNGKVDSDTGMNLEEKKEAILKSSKVQKTLRIVERMIQDSESRNTTPNSKYYDIAGQIWARVTSIKHAIREGLRKFTDDGKLAPAPLIGNSFDEFGRDVFNGIHDKVDTSNQEQVDKAFGGYPNSTAKNYAEAYTAMKAMEARLIGKGQVIIATGKTMENPGKITSKGYLDVRVRNADGTIGTRKIRVAGTIDAIAVDADGNLHLYDFKTHRSGWDLTEKEAIDNGYDIQQSEYAEFLEEEYNLKDQGISIKSVNIIPIAATYPSRSDNTFKETSVPNQLQYARNGDLVNGEPRFVNLEADIFKVEKEFEIPRLSKEELVASYDKLSEDEKKALVEIIQDQSESPADEVSKAEDVVSAKPEVTEDNTEEEEEGLSLKSRRFGRKKNTAKESKADTSIEGTADAINPEDEGGLLARMRELQRNCGGPKKG